MKAQIVKRISNLILITLVIFSITESFSQQMITFKNGTIIKAFITYQTKDTVKYIPESQPQVVYGVSMDQIDRISLIENLPVLPSDSFTGKSYPQYSITYKNGAERKVYITYQTKDTIKYYLDSKPDVVYVETMDNIFRIFLIEAVKPIKQLPVFSSDSLDPYDKKKYLHYKHMTVAGSIFLSAGAVFFGFGIAELVSLSDDNDPSGIGRFFIAIPTAIGAVGVLSGIICVTVGTTNMQKYKKNLNGFSLDLNCTPRQTGISLVYRF